MPRRAPFWRRTLDTDDLRPPAAYAASLRGRIDHRRPAVHGSLLMDAGRATYLSIHTNGGRATVIAAVHDSYGNYREVLGNYRVLRTRHLAQIGCVAANVYA